MSLLKSWVQQPSDRKEEPPARYRDKNTSNTDEHPHLTPFNPKLLYIAPPNLVNSLLKHRGKEPRNSFSSLERREGEFQKYLQQLLDAQAERLANPAAFAAQDETLSNGSNTHSAQNTWPTKTVPIRQPPSEPLSLRAARHGIWSTMQELTLIKNEEFNLLDIERQENEDDLRHVGMWESKRKCLTEEINAIHRSEHGFRVQELSAEEQTLQEHITNMESQLNELRSRHRTVRMKLSSLNNSVQAKLSSYKSSLSMLDTEIGEFLARLPSPPTNQPSSNSSYQVLPPGRRTLQMAAEHLTSVQEAVRSRQEAINVELEALEEGSVVWKDVVSEVTGFETHLRQEISRMDRMAASIDVHNSTESTNTSPARTDDLVSRLDQTLSQLESKFRLSEARNWKLLVCCIGAELEACRKGREVLRESASLSVGGDREDYSKPICSAGEASDRSPVSDCSSPPYHYHGQTKSALEIAAEDDEPDPDLLISHELIDEH